jgi:hypothetical protein
MTPLASPETQALNHALGDATTARQKAKDARAVVPAEQTKAAESEREKAVPDCSHRLRLWSESAEPLLHQTGAT